MVNLAAALAVLFPSAVPLTDYLVEDTGAGPFIKEWNLPDPIPTEAELQSAAASAVKSAIWERIKTERDRRQGLGINVGAHWFHSDVDSRIKQLALVMMGAGVPAGLQWKTKSGEFVTMTPALAGQIFSATAASDQAIFAKAEQHRAAMEASVDPTTYDYSTDWPVAFGE